MQLYVRKNADQRLQPGRAMLAPVTCQRFVSLSVFASIAWLPMAPPALAQSAHLTSQPASQPAPVPAPSVSEPPSAMSARDLYEHVRRSVVAVERNGVPLAIGTVLDGDGRILTSLSGLGGADAADIRYADGTTARAKIGSGDKEFDLALLIPQARKWTEGLAASESDPVGAPLRAMVPARGAHLGPAEAGIKGRVDAHAKDGEPLLPMLDVDVKGPLVAGAPLLDATGGVVAVLVRACKGAATPPDSMPWAAWGAAKDAPVKSAAAACTPVVLGAPVTAIRSFLSKTPKAVAAPAPWLGIRGEVAQVGVVHGVRVIAVAPSSPAEKAGLRAGAAGAPGAAAKGPGAAPGAAPATGASSSDADVIVAADDRPIDTPEKLSDAIGKHVAGETVKLLVFGNDKFREVAVTLHAAP
jgi:S1-C subfamily serine protease